MFVVYYIKCLILKIEVTMIIFFNSIIKMTTKNKKHTFMDDYPEVRFVPGALVNIYGIRDSFCMVDNGISMHQ